MAQVNFIPLNDETDKLVVALINQNNPDAKLDLTKVILGTPTVNSTGGSKKNTDILTKARKNSGYRDSVTCNYDRLNMPALFKNVNVFLNVHNPSNTAALLAELNRLHGLKLTEKDIVNKPIEGSVNPPLTNPEDPDPTPVDHVIEMKPECPAFIGQFTVKIGAAPQVGERLQLVITKTDLDGLTYPDGASETKGQAYIYSYGTDCTPIAKFLKTLAKGTPVVDTALATELNKVFFEQWASNDAAAAFNTKGASVTYAGPTTESVEGGTKPVPGANTAYTNLVKIQLGALCENFQGELMLHYNNV